MTPEERAERLEALRSMPDSEISPALRRQLEERERRLQEQETGCAKSCCKPSYIVEDDHQEEEE